MYEVESFMLLTVRCASLLVLRLQNKNCCQAVITDKTPLTSYTFLFLGLEILRGRSAPHLQMLAPV